jgi:hypothetical protein
MASAAKPPAPPSFYSNVASMGGGSSAKSSGADDKKKMGGEDEQKIVKLLRKLFEQWGDMVGADKDKAGLVSQMSALLDQYDTKFMKGAGKDGAAQPSSTEGQGPAPAAAGGAVGGGTEAQPVPA